MSDETSANLLGLTAEIVASHVANNAVHGGEVATLIKTVYGTGWPWRDAGRARAGR